MACIEETTTTDTQIETVIDSDTSPVKPRRNLTRAFEALCIEESKSTVVESSPTGVAEVGQQQQQQEKENCETMLPTFNLHKELQRELSQAHVDRVSFYSVIHDINKEATSMAENDTLSVAIKEDETKSALVVAATNRSIEETCLYELTEVALIDEETWLLSTISSRFNEVAPAACPPTFLQAMGEKEYENPVTSLSGNSRTQLWKPSRSWWEAKSGKNPWIEPSVHNKRWRYLWPLIHYHKFLAKCIKKLKRNGVDVMHSVTPVAVFLREEVCAISDHLAGVSLFGSDEWTHCLRKFSGWTDDSSAGEKVLRSVVGKLTLRPFSEPGDVDSPLLRSQIDEHFLRAMAAARAQMREEALPKSQYPGHPPAYPYSLSSTNPAIPLQVAADKTGGKPRWSYGHQWHGWDMYNADCSSVQSNLTVDSHQVQLEYDAYSHPYQAHHPYYYQQQHQAVDMTNGMYNTGHHMNTMYNPYWNMPYNANPTYGMDMANSQYYPPVQVAPSPPPIPTQPLESQLNEQPDSDKAVAVKDEAVAEAETPMKHDTTVPQVHMSPYWSYLDQATIAMGLATPAKTTTPSTPRRNDDSESPAVIAYNAQPLLLRPSNYYSYGYGPPSPATQFMMSPQASFAHRSFGGSPRHRVGVSQRPPRVVHKSVSPATVDTTTETSSF